MTVFGVFVFVAMLLIAGIAVDMMRTEHERVRMQGATDRAVLAATMLRENVSGATPEQIAQSYIEAEGLGAQLGGRIRVEEFEGGRRVTIAPGATVPTMFMRMLGVDEVNLATRAEAIEALGSIRFEVVLALDVTGSMGTMTRNGMTRIQNLRIAASDLVRDLLTNRDPGEVALTIVPYAEHVLPPAGFINHFVNLPPSGGPCPDWVHWNSVLNSLQSPIVRRTCDISPWRTVRPYVRDVATAVGIIQGLQASGRTSIDLGVRFGAMFFDPTINGAVETLIANNVVDQVFADYPLPWNEPGVVRAMIRISALRRASRAARMRETIASRGTVGCCTK